METCSPHVLSAESVFAENVQTTQLCVDGCDLKKVTVNATEEIKDMKERLRSIEEKSDAHRISEIESTLSNLKDLVEWTADVVERHVEPNKMNTENSQKIATAPLR